MKPGSVLPAAATDAVLDSVQNMREAPRRQQYDPEKPLLLGMSKAQAKAVRTIGLICGVFFAAAIAVFHLFAKRDLVSSLIWDGLFGTLLLMCAALVLAPNQRYTVYREQITAYSLFNRKRDLGSVTELDGVQSNLNDVLVQRNGKTVMRFPLDGRWDNRVFLQYLEDRFGDRLTLKVNRAYPVIYFAFGLLSAAGGVILLIGLCKRTLGVSQGFLSVPLLVFGASVLVMGFGSLYKRVTIEGETVTFRRLFHRTQTMPVSEIERVRCARNPNIRIPSYRVSWYRNGARLLLMREQTKENIERMKRFPWKSFETDKQKH